MLSAVSRKRGGGIMPPYVFGILLLVLIPIKCSEVFCSQGSDTGARKEKTVISLTLEQAINLALKNNRNLLVSASSVESQELSLSYLSQNSN